MSYLTVTFFADFIYDCLSKEIIYVMKIDIKYSLYYYRRLQLLT
jgi:hypothetical protein